MSLILLILLILLCGAFVGYVWLRGHRVWHCAACSPFHEPTPVE